MKDVLVDRKKTNKLNEPVINLHFHIQSPWQAFHSLMSWQIKMLFSCSKSTATNKKSTTMLKSVIDKNHGIKLLLVSTQKEMYSLYQKVKKLFLV